MSYTDKKDRKAPMKSMLRYLNKIVNIFGFNIIHSKSLVNLNDFMARLKSLPIEINIVYDIGAHLGEYAKAMKKTMPNSKIILFEANEDHREALSKTGFEFNIVTLYREETELPFFALGGTGDSLYKENNYRDYINLEPSMVSARKLDNVVSDRDLPLPDFIKIDVQGSELDVIQGGINSIKSAKVVTLELPLSNYNLGAPNLSETLEFMMKIGFIPFDLVEIHYMDGALIQIDVAFMRNDIIEKCYGDITRSYTQY